MARVYYPPSKKTRTTRGTKMLEAAHKELEREAQAAKRATQAYKTPPTKAAPPEAPPALKRKKPRQCQFA